LADFFKHFVITPFYVRRHFKGQSEPAIAPPSWLDNRIDLFERYCLPSVIGQSSSNFVWWLYFDEATPPEYIARIERSIAGHPHIAIKRCKLWETTTLHADINAVIEPSSEWVLTTRFDNDDGLHRDFIATLHRQAAPRRELLNFPHGVLLFGGKSYFYTHPSNAFLSFMEPAADFQTIWNVAHESAGLIAPIRQMPPEPGFLQVVHGGNVSNKPRGRRIARAAAFRGFEAINCLFDPPVPESAGSIAWDNATSVLLWRFRDQLIALAKSVKRVVGGR